MYDMVVKNGTVVTAEGLSTEDVAISGERIVTVGPNLSGTQSIDASDCYVIPGGVDPHVHLQTPLAGRVTADSFQSGTVAALCGGTTSVVDFVTPAPGQSLMDALQLRKEEAEGNVAADYGLHMTIPSWHASDVNRLTDIPEAALQGCATFKMYQAYQDMELDDVSLLRAMRAVADVGGGVVLHSEVGPVIEELRYAALRDGHAEPIWHERTRPPRLEASAVHRAVALAQLADVPLYIFHVGAQAVIDTIRQMRYQGIELYSETCPQYLLLSANRHLGRPDGNLYICAPPLRYEADQTVLWQALNDRTLDVVSTDHCPWTTADKAQPDFASVPGGVASIESRLSLVHHFGVSGGLLSLERWVETCSTAPARLMGLQHKGQIAPGYDADIVLFDPAIRKRISVATLHEAADWTPYDGLEVCGWPRTVLLRGTVVIKDGGPVGKTQGRFIKRSLHPR